MGNGRRTLVAAVAGLLVLVAAARSGEQPLSVHTTDAQEATTAFVTLVEDEEDTSENESSDWRTEMPNIRNSSSSMEIYTLHVFSDIQHRYAKTLVHSKIANLQNESNEIQFKIVLPDSAFISGFIMEVKGKAYKALVKEKKEAEKEYQAAVQQGQSAGHVAMRDTNTFTVSVNVEPRSKLSFNITYEELLSRKLSLYKHVISLDPGQTVRDLSVNIQLNEARSIVNESVTAYGTYFSNCCGDHNIRGTREKNPITVTKRNSGKSLLVNFSPTMKQQQLALRRKDDLSHQVVFTYDVDRKSRPEGEVLLMDGYFVHFFVPRELPVLPKHVIFVLDTSGSMWGTKISQLKDAMSVILDDLSEKDYFSIIQFNTDVEEWSPHQQDSVGLRPECSTFKATSLNIQLAKDYVKSMEATGGTNIYEALRKALQLASKRQYNTENKNATDLPQPMILFLTDGVATIGQIRPSRILAGVRAHNTETKATVFTLAFGDNASFIFLKRLALQNNGFARKIYEAADASLQLQSFYHEISSPVLSNVTFNYVRSMVDEAVVTQSKFHSFYRGSELVVAGKVKKEKEDDHTENIFPEVSAWSFGKHYQQFPSEVIKEKKQTKDSESNYGVLERLWAYLYVKQLLDEALMLEEKAEHSQMQLQHSTMNNETVKPSPKEMALNIALKYQFVTSVTSLVVVKPSAGRNSTITFHSQAPKDAAETMDTAPYHNKIMAIAMPPYFPGKRPATTIPQFLEQDKIGSLLPAITTTRKPILTLNDITWLDQYLGTDGQLHIISRNSSEENRTLNIYSIQEKVPVQPCTTPNNERATCRPLVECVLPEFKDDYDIFLQYICSFGESDSSVGVCCPVSTGPGSSPNEPATENYSLVS
ncbi:inter-alpha-trypsin inhibitor heavy chain H4-like [Schistocerca nitens]|uniref:inter-alpha-trypsin inhibitor heavy chain H4-like n=1 Tax=Schistocerca nitens TaxID=7011 RepID=UPI0021190224|nr:inter-alpha-trypsin inhibitor heavy chain H4-like [Schistocerca nitens]